MSDEYDKFFFKLLVSRDAARNVAITTVAEGVATSIEGIATSGIG